MKNIFLYVIFIILFLSSNTNSQLLPIYSQYFFHTILINPGVAGSSQYMPITLTVRQQWIGIKNAPSTQVLSFHNYIEYLKIGYGTYLFNDNFGPLTLTGGQACFAYHLPVHTLDAKLSMGLSIKVYQYKYDQTNFEPINKNDPALKYSLISQIIPESDFGLYFYSKKFSVGISILNLLQYKVDFLAQNLGKNYIPRHFHFIASYLYEFSEKFYLSPSILYLLTFPTPNYIDLNLKLIYLKNYIFGFSYKTNKSASPILGIKISNFLFGYSFDYSFSEIKKHSKGSHEILINYNIMEKKKYTDSRLL